MTRIIGRASLQERCIKERSAQPHLLCESKICCVLTVVLYSVVREYKAVDCCKLSHHSRSTKTHCRHLHPLARTFPPRLTHTRHTLLSRSRRTRTTYSSQHTHQIVRTSCIATHPSLRTTASPPHTPSTTPSRSSSQADRCALASSPPPSPSCTSIVRSLSDTKAIASVVAYDPIETRRSANGCAFVNRGKLSLAINV